MKKTELFHPGELYFQNKVGVANQAAGLASRLIQDRLSKQHQDFFSQINMIFIASVDQGGLSWASIIIGSAGFIHVIDDKNFKINTNIIKHDPLVNNLIVGQYFGFLGLQFDTRRRNRISAKLVKKTQGILYFEVELAFGNCPKYIQTRKIKKIKINNSNRLETTSKNITCFDNVTKRIISSADTFFISSFYTKKDYRGCDISHRGGKPGFVNIIDNKSLSFDDFDGNNLFMTLGNLVCNPLAGLLFIDFNTSEILQLSCRAEVLEYPDKKFQRQVRLVVEQGYYFKSALLVESEFLEYSPYLP